MSTLTPTEPPSIEGIHRYTETHYGAFVARAVSLCLLGGIVAVCVLAMKQAFFDPIAATFRDGRLFPTGRDVGLTAMSWVLIGVVGYALNRRVRELLRAQNLVERYLNENVHPRIRAVETEALDTIDQNFAQHNERLLHLETSSASLSSTSRVSTDLQNRMAVVEAFVLPAENKPPASIQDLIQEALRRDSIGATGVSPKVLALPPAEKSQPG